MRKLFILLFIPLPFLSVSQSKTTRAFTEKYENAFTLFFYQNTLQMLNQTDNEEFDMLIKDIDKMKYVRVNKAEYNVTDEVYKSLISDYHDESFEDLMTMRQSGLNVNVYIQEDDGVTTGLVFLMSNEESLSILDIKGKVPLDKLGNLISKVRSIENFKLD